MNSDSAAQRSLAAAVRQFLNQAGRLLEEQDPRALFADNGPLHAALAGWRQAVDAQTSTLSIEKARTLETEKLKLMGEVGSLKKECADLRERNEQLRAEVVRLNQREQENKQQLLEAEFRGGGARAQVKTLDLEIRDLRRRIRELEGGPPLTPSEAAPRAIDKLQALFAGAKDPSPVADNQQVPADSAAADARPARGAEGDLAAATAAVAAGGGEPLAERKAPRPRRAAARKTRPRADRAEQARRKAKPAAKPAKARSARGSEAKAKTKQRAGATRSRRVAAAEPKRKAATGHASKTPRRSSSAKPGTAKKKPRNPK